MQSSLNSQEFKGRALLSVTVDTVLSNTDNNEFLPLKYQCIFVKMQWLLVFILVTVYFRVLWALILEETLDGRVILRTGSSEYC